MRQILSTVKFKLPLLEDEGVSSEFIHNKYVALITETCQVIITAAVSKYAKQNLLKTYLDDVSVLWLLQTWDKTHKQSTQITGTSLHPDAVYLHVAATQMR